MPKLLIKIISPFLAFLVFTLTLAPYFSLAKAAEGSTWYSQSFQEWEDKVGDPSNPQEIFGERYTAAQVQWIIYGLFRFILTSTINTSALRCIVTGASELSACLQAAGIDLSQTNTQPIAVTTQTVEDKSLTQLVFAERPLSGISYIREKTQKLSIVQEAQAQSPGFGFNSLQVIQDMWRAVRNVSYGLFIIAAIAFSFMIMFRVKIDPQTVITVQSAIPKLIIALVLVTFSYAIAGFLIDIMYIVYGIISLIGSRLIPDIPINPASLFQFMTAGRVGIGSVGVDTGIFGLLALYLTVFPLALGIVLFFTMGLIISSLAALLAGAAFVGIASLLTTPIGWVLGLIALILLAIIIILALWQGIKIIFTLLKAFTFILLLTIAAPLQIVAGVVIPSLGFSNWLKSYASNLAIFVTTSVLIFLAFLFMIFGVFQATNIVPDSGGVISIILGYLGNLFFGTAITTAFSELARPTPWPPLIGAVGPLTGGATSLMGLLFLGVSFVIFTLIPKSSQIVQGFIAGKSIAPESAIGEAAGTFWGYTGGALLGEARKDATFWKNLYNGLRRAGQSVGGEKPSEKPSGSEDRD